MPALTMLHAVTLADQDRTVGNDGPFWLPVAPDFPLAECRNEIPDLWFPDESARGIATKIEAAAVDICYGCPHMMACADYAVSQHIHHGIWGGLTEADRRRMWQPQEAA